MRSLIVVLVSLLLISAGLAQEVNFSPDKKSVVVENLTIGIESDNNGLNISSARVLYDLIDEGYMNGNDADKAMIPLLRLLDNGETDEVRIAAALALFKLGNSIGIYKLRGVAVFDDNERLGNICKNLYYSYHILNGTEYLVNLQ
jgi:hypothetical protein